MALESHSRLQSHPLQRGRAVLVLIVLAVAGFWPVLNAHPLMDDHLFFSWLERTPWRDAVWQRLTGNWIPEFPQLQMYRPVSGLWQAITYRFFRADAFPHHFLNLLLHGGTCLLAGTFVCKLTGSRKAGWLVSGLTLVHPRAALGVSLIFNFTDVLSAFLMMLSLVVFCAIRQDRATCTNTRIFSQLQGGPRQGGGVTARYSKAFLAALFKGGPASIFVLWASVGLALGTKEACLPMVAVLLAAEILWPSSKRSVGRILTRLGGPLVLCTTYLVARTYFIGHPFRTHNSVLGFPLPDYSNVWTLFWDCLLMASTLGGTLLIRHWPAVRRQLPPSSDWMLLWAGCMLLPATHFCSQVTLRPWFFDERYWYIPLIPLSVFAAALLTHGTKLSSILGAVILAITLPGAIGFFIAGMTFVVTSALLNKPTEPEIKRTIAALFLVALTIVLWQRCGQIRLRADEAAGLQAQLKRAIMATPPENPIAILEFTEPAAEPNLSFNGALQWLLTPPFFPANVSERFFFAYPTWDSPPTNRFWDRTTPRLLEKVDAGQEVSLYSWNAESRELRSLGREKRRTPGALPNFQSIPMGPIRLDSRSTSGLASWHSTGPPFDPNLNRVLAMKFTAAESESSLVPVEIGLSWVSQRSPHWSAAKEIRVHQPTSLVSMRALPSAELCLHPGRRVDWLLGGEIIELRITANQPLVLKEVQIGPSVPESILRESNHFDEYASPAMKFLWETESWWRLAK